MRPRASGRTAADLARHGSRRLALACIPLSFHASGARDRHADGGRIPAGRRGAVEAFPFPFVHRVTLVIQGIPPADSEEGRSVLRDVSAALRKEPGVAGVLSRLDWVDPIFLGRDGGTFVVAGLDPGGAPVETLIPRLRVRSDELQARLRGRYPAARMQWTGETPLNFDLRKASADDARSAELRILPVTLLLLLVAFGSLVAALLPLFVGWLSISVTMGCAALLARHLHLSILVKNVATMLGLGVGIDYALLMVSRFAKRSRGRATRRRPPRSRPVGGAAGSSRRVLGRPRLRRPPRGARRRAAFDRGRGPPRGGRDLLLSITVLPVLLRLSSGSASGRGAPLRAEDRELCHRPRRP